MALLFSQPTGYLIMYYSGELSQISLHSRAYVRIVHKKIEENLLDAVSWPALGKKNVQPREMFT